MCPGENAGKIFANAAEGEPIVSADAPGHCRHSVDYQVSTTIAEIFFGGSFAQNLAIVYGLFLHFEKTIVTESFENISAVVPPSAALLNAGERRRVTVLFADMADFTPTAEKIGEEGAYELMRPIFTVMASAVRQHGGEVHDFTGDGIMAVFGIPVALEDATLRACRAALQIQAGLGEIEALTMAKFGVRPRIRIGINTGPVVAGQMESGRASISGDTVNFAARLQTFAEPGTAVLSDAAQRLVEGLIECTFAGAHPVKGKSEPQRIHRLDAIKTDAVRFDAARSRGLSDYVGRAAELQRLQGELIEAADTLRVIDIVGDPGMGKSRLLHEFLQKIDPGETTVFHGSCTPDGVQTPFRLFIELVRSCFRITAGETTAEVAGKLHQGLSALGLSSPENQALLLNLLGLRVPEGALKGLDGTLVGLRTRELLQGLLLAFARSSMTILALEDLHWIDGVSEQVLLRLVAAAANQRLLVLHTRRPGYQPPWIEAESDATLPLARLPEAETQRIVQQRMGMPALPEPLVRLVLEKADGNALFAEELTSYLFERGLVRREGDALHFDEAALAHVLPPSVQSLLAARVDALPPEARALLQAASVIGRSFEPDLLGCITGATAAVELRLAAAAALDLLHVDTASGNYVFKHALVRDALYDSLLSGPRAELHQRVGVEIERRSGNRLGEVAEILAHHFSHTPNDVKAFEYLLMAGQKSLGVYSLKEAANYLTEAEALLDGAAENASQDGFADFLIGSIQVLQFEYLPAAVVEKTRKYRSRIDGLGDRPEVVRVAHYEVWALCWLRRFTDAFRVQAACDRMCERLGDDRSFAYAAAQRFFLDAVDCHPSADLVTRSETAIAAAARTGDAYITGWLRFTIAWNAFHRGHIARARALADDLMRTGAEMRDPRSIGLGQWLQCWIALVTTDYELTLAMAEQSLRTAITPFDSLNAELAKAIALVFLKRVDEGAPLLRKSRSVAARYERLYEFVGSGPSYGVALVLEGRFAEGVRYLEAASKTFSAEGYEVVAAWYKIVIVQIYLDILDGGGKPPLGILLRNIKFLAWVKLNGRNWIFNALDQILKNPLYTEESFHTGLVYYWRGVCYFGQGNKVAAKPAMATARTIVACHGRTSVLDKIDALLAEIG